MISLIEAQNFRCLREVSQPLGRFHVLVGPNGSGKSTFLDVIGFLGNLVSYGLVRTLDERNATLWDLASYPHSSGCYPSPIVLAIECKIPEKTRTHIRECSFDSARYEVKFGEDKDHGVPVIIAEEVSLRASKKGSLGKSTLLEGNYGHTSFFEEEWITQDESQPASYKFNFGPDKSALANVPDDVEKFPIAVWLKELLLEGVQSFVLDSLEMRKASPPGRGTRTRTDGGNLPQVVNKLAKEDRSRFNLWLEHLRTAIPDLKNVRVVDRPDDKHQYLMLEYRGEVRVPSWMVSDGTLRLLALTLPAYATGFHGIYLIEEPENGIHPRAVETVFDSLSSVYDAKVLVATHSPVMLNLAERQQLLCFSKDANGHTEIVPGDQHPALMQWQQETSLGALFAAGVLG